MHEIDGRPRWAPRVTRSSIRRLYENDASGTLDGELVDEVAWALWERCEDILVVSRAADGLATCPRCRAEVAHDGRRDAVLRCRCGWSLAWRDYQSTYRKRQLHGGAARLAFEDFVHRLPLARSTREKVLLVDRLIHQFHASVRFGPSRPAGSNLIEGKGRDVIAFLEELAGTPAPDAERERLRARWRADLEHARQLWAGGFREGRR